MIELHRLQSLPSCFFGYWFVVLAVPLSPGNANAWEPKSKAVARGEKALALKSEKLTESSGLAFSQVDEDCFWSHNDSGGKARLFAFDEKGDLCGRLTLKDVKARDWEDIAAYRDEVPRLVIADVGDNESKRESVSLYLLDEPNPKKKHEVESFQHIEVRYEGGARNCESVAVDGPNRRILLLSKSHFVASLHEVPLPARSAGDGPIHSTAVARRIADAAIPMATGMDLHRETGDLWITNYFQAIYFSGPKPIEKRLSAAAKPIALPKLKQIEAIAVDDKGRVWVTSEGKPTWMHRVLLRE